jgi:hypothetical protein
MTVTLTGTTLNSVYVGQNPPFEVADLFASGEQGAWYDPSDFTTLFEDSAGTTPITTVERPVGLMLDKSGRGNHAFQTSSAARPALRNRYNLLTFSEQFENAAWDKSTGATVSQNTADTTDPLGGNTADKIVETATTGSHRVYQERASTTEATFTATCYIKKGTRQWAWMGISATGAGASLTNQVQFFDLDNITLGQQNSAQIGANTIIVFVSAGIEDVGNGWRRCRITARSQNSPTIQGVFVGLASADGTNSYAGATNENGYIWGAQLIVTNDLPSNAYQRIAAAPTVGSAPTYDTDTTKFPPYLEFVADDFMICDSIVAGTSYFEGANAPLTMFAGARRNTTGAFMNVFGMWDNTGGVAAENDNLGIAYTATTTQITGTTRDYVASPPTSNDKNVFAGTNAAPETGVITWLRTSTDGQARYNGVAGTAADQTHPALGLALATIGALRRGSTPTIGGYLNGYLYGLIIRGAESNATQISNTESYLAAKMQVTL